MLVLVVVLAILVYLLVPIVIDPGGGGNNRWITCSYNLRQLSAALLSYENSHGQYPGYANVLTTTNGKPYVDPDTGNVSPVSFVVPILPILDRPDLYRAWSHSAASQAAQPSNQPATDYRKVRLDLLQCRSDPPSNPQTTSNSYVVNCGMKDGPGSPNMPRDWAENGIFFDLFTGDPRVTGQKPGFKMATMSNAFIMRSDGLQQTLLMSENVDAGLWTDTDEARIGMLWNADGSIDQTKNPPHLVPPHDFMQINRGIGLSELDPGRKEPSRKLDPATYARPSSYHPGGVNVVFCDGHVQFLSEKIDYYVYCLLMSTNGERVRMPGSNQLIPGFDVKFADAWLNR
jgi:prepilin-type processing-associated H-X9-DG protein